MSLSSFITMIMWHHKMNWKMFSYISRRIGIEFLLFLPQISLRLWWWWFFFILSISLNLVMLLLSHFSRVWLCATPYMAAHQAPPSLGFSRQEHWSGLPFPSPVHESERWKWRRSVASDSVRPHEVQPTRLLHPWDFPGKSTGVGCHCLLQYIPLGNIFQEHCNQIKVKTKFPQKAHTPLRFFSCSERWCISTSKTSPLDCLL